MAGLTPLPPTLFHSSQRLTHAQAHAQLTTFLDLAENDAAYRPDSTLTERGPQSASTGANPNLTLHHLKRILQGIEGKRIGGADIGRFFGDGAAAAGVSRLPWTEKKEKRKHDDNSVDLDGRRNSSAKRTQFEGKNPENAADEVGIAAEEQDGWQDKEDYELAQREGGLELVDNDRQPGLGTTQPQDEEEARDMLNVQGETVRGKVGSSRRKGGDVDKDARKEAKKARRKEEKRDKNAAIRNKE